MFSEVIRYCVFATCQVISIALAIYLDLLLLKGEELSDIESFFVISPVVIITALYGFFEEHFKRIFFYSIASGALLTVFFYVETYFIVPEPLAEPDIVELAYTKPIPYLLVILGMSFFMQIVVLGVGFLLGFTKRKIFN